MTDKPMSALGRRAKRSDIPDDLVIGFIRTHGFAAWKYLTHTWPPKVVEAKYEHMVRRGLLDYGVSVRTAWVVADLTVHEHLWGHGHNPRRI